MKKYFILAAAAAIVLGACSKNNVEIAEVQTPVSFGTYLGKTISKAGAEVAINSAQTLAQNNGFGVFAYYTEATAYAAGQTAYTPNFMYNEHISGTDAASPAWSYTNTKYWPNGNTVADNDNAEGVDAGKVSFFAYGPYVDHTASLGSTGIIGFSANNVAGDPTVTYVLSGVDLLWGTAGTNGQTVTGADQAGTTLSGGKAAVNTDLTKQKVAGKVQFAFKHALAKLGKLQVVADFAGESAINGGTQGANTKITVNEVVITPEAAKSKGTFNLATGVWTLDNSATAAASAVTIANTDMATAVAEPASFTTWADDPAGVTTTVANLLKDDSKYILFMPGTQPTFNVKITYTVRTKDTNLAKGYSEVTQVINKDVTFGAAFEQGKNYNLILRLGLTDVRFDATVSAWEDADSSTNASVNLPVNVA